MAILVKLLIVALIGYFVIWPWLRRRWPKFTRRLNFALLISLIGVVLFKLLASLHHGASAPEPPPFSTTQPPGAQPAAPPESSGRP